VAGFDNLWLASKKLWKSLWKITGMF